MSYMQIQKGGLNNKSARYVYLAWNDWDADRRRSVQHRFYVGRIVEDGRVLVNKKFSGDRTVFVTVAELQAKAKERSVFETWLRGTAAGPTLTGGVARVDIVGDGWVVRHLADACGLSLLLREVFGEEESAAWLGLAAHQLVTGHALYRAEAWLAQRELPQAWKSPLVAESTVHGFVARLGADVGRRESFLERWVARHKGPGALLHDITSISTYSPALELAEWGYNRDDETLPQINFSLAATPGGLPLFYRIIPGSIPDVRTLAVSLQVAHEYGLDKLSVSLDRGFYSRSNLGELCQLDAGFLLGVPWSVKEAQSLFQKSAARLKSPRHGFLYAGAALRHVAEPWLLDGNQFSAHLYFDPARHSEQALRFEKTVRDFAAKAEREVFRSRRAAGVWLAENTGKHGACLRVTTGPDGKPRIIVQTAASASATARAGYSIILTRGRAPQEEIAERVLADYRARDVAEKLFDAFKTEDGQFRLRTAHDASVQGRFFLGFVTLILRSELEKRMRAAGLHRSSTTAGVLDELAKVKALSTRTGTRILLEVSKRQRLLLAALKLPEFA